MIRHPSHSSGVRRGFTLVELLVVIGVIALLISILLPALSKAQRASRAVKCAAQLKQIAAGALNYAADFQGYLPYSSDSSYDSRWYKVPILNNRNKIGGWATRYLGQQVATNGESLKILRCPSDSSGTVTSDTTTSEIVSAEAPSYVCNAYTIVLRDPTLTVSPKWMYKDSIHNFVKISSVQSCMLFADGWDAIWAGHSSPGDDYTIPDPVQTGTLDWGYYCVEQTAPGKIWTARHDGRANVAFADGHVESFTKGEMTVPSTGSYVKMSPTFRLQFLPKGAQNLSVDDGGTGGY